MSLSVQSPMPDIVYEFISNDNSKVNPSEVFSGLELLSQATNIKEIGIISKKEHHLE
mgnify:CR=1 FL=1